MKLYFYCSSGSLLEYFTINKIVCNEYLERKKRKVVHSLGLINEKCLFLTQKKLASDQRCFGFGQDISEIPITIEISIPDSDLKKWMVVLLKDDGTLSDQFVPIGQEKEAVGYFVAGEVPYSYISAILFEDENVKRKIHRPSKDLYYPEYLYGVIDNTFMEQIPIDMIVESGDRIKTLLESIDVVDVVSKRNKYSSIILNTILETVEWPYGNRHIANFDEISLKLLGLAETAENETDGLYSQYKNDELQDNVLKDYFSDSNEAGTIGVFFGKFISQLIETEVTSFTQKELDEILDAIWNSNSIAGDDKENLKKKIDQIKGIVYGNISSGLEELLITFSGGYEVLQALVFFLRSPMASLKLKDGLETYKVKADVRRYAWIMFAALNGIERVYADKTSNNYVMAIAEKYAMHKCQNQSMVNDSSSEWIPERSFKLMMEEVVSLEEIREFILSDKYVGKQEELIKEFFANKTLSKGFKEKDYQKIANPFKGVVPEEEYMTIQDAEAVIEKFRATLKKSKKNYDREAFLETIIRNQKKYTEVFDRDPDFWKTIYKDGKSI